MLALFAVSSAAWSPLVLPKARSPLVKMSATPTLTETIMAKLPPDAQTGGAGGQTTYEALLRLDDAWTKLRSGELPPPRDIVFEEPDAPVEAADFDVVVCGGNIGILLATALVLRGLRVAVLEAGVLRGREQDWNASRKEVMELVEAGIISQEEVAEVIGIEFNPVSAASSSSEQQQRAAAASSSSSAPQQSAAVVRGLVKGRAPFVRLPKGATPSPRAAAFDSRQQPCHPSLVHTRVFGSCSRCAAASQAAKTFG